MLGEDAAARRPLNKTPGTALDVARIALCMLAVVSAACRDSSPSRRAAPVAPTPVVARAGDGLAELAIPDGALPDGVRPADIRITPVENGPQPGNASVPLAVYRLEPAGLRLNKAATITITVPEHDPSAGVPLVLNVGHEGAELANTTLVSTDPAGALTLSAELTHFSEAVVLRGLFRATLSDPGDHVVGETFRVAAVVTALDEVVVVEREGIRHEIRLSGDPFDLSGTLYAFDWDPSRAGTQPTQDSHSVAPTRVHDRPPLTRVLDGSHTVQQTFTCVGDSGPRPYDVFWIWYSAEIAFRYELRSITPAGAGRWTQLTSTVFVVPGWSPVRHCRAVVSSASDASAANRPPEVGPIRAFFDPGRFMTTYDVLASDPDGDALTYVWQGADCGEAATVPGEPYRLRWRHAHPPCDPTTEHATILVIVDVGDGRSTVRCIFRGAADGVGPPCRRVVPLR